MVHQDILVGGVLVLNTSTFEFAQIIFIPVYVANRTFGTRMYSQSKSLFFTALTIFLGHTISLQL